MTVGISLCEEAVGIALGVCRDSGAHAAVIITGTCSGRGRRIAHPKEVKHLKMCETKIHASLP